MIRDVGFRVRQITPEWNREGVRAGLPWLSSDKARSSVEFGTQLGRLDSDLALLDRIIAMCRQIPNPNLARGYFAGVSESTQPELPSEAAEHTRERLNTSLDGLSEADPVLAFHVMTLVGDFVHSFNRAIAAVRAKKIRTGLLYTFVAWNGPRHTWPREARVAAETLLEAAQGGDEDAANTGIEFIVFVLMRTTEGEDKLEWLQQVFHDKSLDTIFGLLERACFETSKGSHWFSQIFAGVLPANPDRATSILLRFMQSDSYETSEAASGLFPTVGAERP